MTAAFAVLLPLVVLAIFNLVTWRAQHARRTERLGRLLAVVPQPHQHQHQRRPQR